MTRPPSIWISIGGAEMVDYSMCCQTVTVYRRTDAGIFRLEIPNCFIRWEDRMGFDKEGLWQDGEFLLIQPGQEQLVFCGDRVFEGIGPQIGIEDWEGFVPTAVTGLGEVNYASAYRWEGKFCHTEAGRT